MSRRIRRLSLMFSLTAVLASALAGSASAAMHTWTSIPGAGTARMSAIIDNYSSGSWTSRTSGRVWVDPAGGCVTAKFKPYARLAADGTYNSLAKQCGYGGRYLNWSDSFHLAYNGIKFQLCASNGCGASRNIAFY